MESMILPVPVSYLLTECASASCLFLDRRISLFFLKRLLTGCIKTTTSEHHLLTRSLFGDRFVEIDLMSDANEPCLVITLPPRAVRHEGYETSPSLTAMADACARLVAPSFWMQALT
jgi:hypothetical protein